MPINNIGVGCFFIYHNYFCLLCPKMAHICDISDFIGLAYNNPFCLNTARIHSLINADLLSDLSMMCNRSASK